MSGRSRDDAAHTELAPDAWHQTDDGNYYVDCPECGAAASLMNVVNHGRCNGYMNQREGETDLDEEAFDCTAKLWFELGYTSDPEPATDAAAAPGESASDAETGEGVAAEGSPAGTEGTVDDEQSSQ